ncbi:MAG: hypothetical protein ABI832_04240 [bacterium]
MITSISYKSARSGGLSVVAALLLGTAAMAQDDTAIGSGDPGDVHVVQTWHDINPAGGDEGIAVGEPDPTSGAVSDPADGTDVAADDGSDPVDDIADDPGDATGDATGDDGVTVQYWHDLNPDANLADPELAYQNAAGVPLPNERSRTSSKPNHGTVAVANLASQCLALHPQLPWLCEWQNGAGQ